LERKTLYPRFRTFPLCSEMKIGLISMPIEEDEFNVYEKNHPYIVFKINNLQEFRKRYLNVLKKCIEFDLNYICFAEGAFPATSHDKDFFDYIIREFVKKENIYLIGGSYWDLEKSSNSLPLFFPEMDAPVIINKKQSAINLNENLKTDHLEPLCGFNTIFGMQTFLICADAYQMDIPAKLEFINKKLHDRELSDITSNLKSVNTSLQNERIAGILENLENLNKKLRKCDKYGIDIITIIAWEPNDKYGKDIAKTLSYNTKSLVIYLNNFLYGEPMVYFEKKNFTLEKHPLEFGSYKYNLYTVTINPRDIHEKRIKSPVTLR